MKRVVIFLSLASVIAVLVIAFWSMAAQQSQETEDTRSTPVPATTHPTAMTEPTATIQPTAKTQPTPENLTTDLQKVVPAEVLEIAEVGVLNVNPQRIESGQDLSYTGSGFTPNGRVLISLNLPGDPEKTVEWETKANNAGNVEGTITVPIGTTAGNWVVLAMDVERMYQQLLDITQGKEVNLHTYMQANEVRVDR